MKQGGGLFKISALEHNIKRNRKRSNIALEKQFNNLFMTMNLNLRVKNLHFWDLVGNFAKNTDLINLKMTHGDKVVDLIRHKIDQSQDGTLFFNNSFPEFDDEYVGKVLSDLVRQGVIHRLSRGIYLKARETKFGLVYPSTSEIAKAIARRDNAEILPTGSTALNMLGLSDQVTMNPVFITSGSARKLKCGNRTITFKRGVPKNFAVKGKVTRLIVQAMKAIGEQNFNDDDRKAIALILVKYPETDTIKHDLAVMPSWIKKNITIILNDKNHEQLAEA